MRPAADLFPETSAAAEPIATEWHGTTALDGWGHPRVEVRLIGEWSAQDGWRCGWFVHVDTAVDEWHPAATDEWRRHAQYPWHRPNEIPQSKQFAIAAGIAARAAKIVLEQMLAYAADAAAVADGRQLSIDIERQAQQWLCGAA